MWIRVHSTPRLFSFHPYGASGRPLLVELTGDRVAELNFLNGSKRVIMDIYYQVRERMGVSSLWIGTTTFLKIKPSVSELCKESVSELHNPVLPTCRHRLGLQV